MITAAIITTAAIILTSGLALLHGDAIEETAIPNESAVPESENASPEVETAIPDDEPSAEETPDGESEEVVVDRDTYNGCITIDIYEHATGKYVSQVIVDSAEAYAKLGELVEECYTNRVQLFNPNVGSATREHWLPSSQYRIEVMAGTIFAYSYGVENNTVFESLMSGVTFSGGEAIIGYIDSLIADEISALRRGVKKGYPDHKASIVEVEKFIAYWEGEYNETLDTYIPGVGRHTPRFPYAHNVNEEGHIDTVLVDVYEHATGKLVGRIDISSTDNYQAICETVDKHFDPSKELDPDVLGKDAVLPEAKYRIEIYAFSKGEYGGYSGGLFVAYSYENGGVGDVFELVQIGLAFGGAEEMIKALDALIADGMAEIEAGNGVIPEKAGCDISSCTSYWESQGRYSERFPYIAE